MRSEMHDLIRSAAAGPTSEPDIADIFRRARKRAVMMRSVSVFGVVAVLAAGAAGASVVRDLGPSAPAGPDDSLRNSGQPTSPGENETPAAEPCDGIDFCTQIDTPVEQILVGTDDIWAAGFSVVRIDASTNEVAASRQGLGGFARGLFMAEKRIWTVMEIDGVSDPKTVVIALDPTSLEILGQSDPLPATNSGDVYAAVGGGAVWVSGPGAELARVDTDTLAVDRYSYEDVLDPSADVGPPLVAFADESVWLADKGGTLITVDPLTGRVKSDEELGPSVYAMGSDGTTLWVAQHGGAQPRLLRFRGGERTGIADLLEGGPLLIATGERAAYVLIEHPDGTSIVEIDSETLEINDPVDTLPGLGFGGLGAGPAGVWTSDIAAGTIFRERP